MENVYENKMKLEFLSKSSNEAFARITVASFASQLDPSIEEISDIKWVDISHASAVLTYENDKTIVKKAKSAIKERIM